MKAETINDTTYGFDVRKLVFEMGKFFEKLLHRHSFIISFVASQIVIITRECVRNLDLRVQVHPGELRVSKQRVHIVLEASKSAGAKGDVPKICGFVHPLHPC